MRSDDDLLSRAILGAKVQQLWGEKRRYYLYACGERADGTLVYSPNHSVQGQPCPTGHAEARVVRKLGRHGRIAVARVRRDGSIGCARPCESCLSLLHKAKVREVYYTTRENEWGVIRL